MATLSRRCRSTFQGCARNCNGAASDAVIAGVHGEPHSPLPIAIFETQPETRVLLIETRDVAADLYELLPQRRRLGPVSPAEIVRALEDDGARSLEWSTLRHDVTAPQA